jgi:hypothetical protein
VLEGVGAVPLTALGIGAIIQYLFRPLLGLLPSVDPPSLPLPDISWPDLRASSYPAGRRRCWTASLTGSRSSPASAR